MLQIDSRIGYLHGEWDQCRPKALVENRVCHCGTVADGLDKSLDWQSAGYDMPPLEWHDKLKAAREKRRAGPCDEDLPLILDCRNEYETDVGRFEGAEPLNTENFRDSWDVLKE